MPRRARENLAIALFFCPIGYEIAIGWDRFVALGCQGAAWLHVLIPAAVMTLAIIIWPQR